MRLRLLDGYQSQRPPRMRSWKRQLRYWRCLRWPPDPHRGAPVPGCDSPVHPVARPPPSPSAISSLGEQISPEPYGVGPGACPGSRAELCPRGKSRGFFLVHLGKFAFGRFICRRSRFYRGSTFCPGWRAAPQAGLATTNSAARRWSRPRMSGGPGRARWDGHCRSGWRQHEGTLLGRSQNTFVTDYDGRYGRLDG